MITNRIDRVAIVGGIHGCELTGAYLIKKFERSPELVKRNSFETLTLLANPRAFKAGTRYIDRDLNRSFGREDLNNPSLSSYEDLRAKEIYQILGDEAGDRVDFIIDLHSTTANMGLTVILGKENNPLILNLVAHLTKVNPLIKFFRWSDTQTNCVLRSLSPRSITIEVGAIAHGTLDSWYFEQTENLVRIILDFLNREHQVPATSALPTIEIFEGKELVDYPRNGDGELTAMIHPQLKNYKALNLGDPLFLTFEGQTIVYEGNDSLYPTFIGESAYVEKGIAFCLSERCEIPLKSNFEQPKENFQL